MALVSAQVRARRRLEDRPGGRVEHIAGERGRRGVLRPAVWQFGAGVLRNGVCRADRVAEVPAAAEVRIGEFAQHLKQRARADRVGGAGAVAPFTRKPGVGVVDHEIREVRAAWLVTQGAGGCAERDVDDAARSVGAHGRVGQPLAGGDDGANGRPGRGVGERDGGGAGADSHRSDPLAVLAGGHAHRDSPIVNGRVWAADSAPASCGAAGFIERSISSMSRSSRRMSATSASRPSRAVRSASAEAFCGMR